MSERKNHLSIDGGQVKEDDNVASYKQIPESETEFRTSKSNLGKSKEKISPDGAEEKLLQKEDEAKIVTRVDMADAKYVVEDHRNGDAKIELDANKRQFSGLTKEELLRYADDPFWVKLRWLMFVLFWALWLCMLGGAIAIIIRAPKCAPPPPKTWFEKGPLVDVEKYNYSETEKELPLLKSSSVQGIFIDVPTYEVLNNSNVLQEFKNFVTKAKDYGIKVIVDLTPNFVPSTHEWFRWSENRTGVYQDYFIWADNKDFETNGDPKPPNNWRSIVNTSAWTWSAGRKQFYLNQYGEGNPDLNFNNPDVLAQFNKVLKTWMQAGADGVRLDKARQLLVNMTLENEVQNSGRGSNPDADLTSYAYWRHKHTSDMPQLDTLFTQWSQLVDDSGSSPGKGETVFTTQESGERTELFLLRHNATSLRPRSSAPIRVSADVTALAKTINARLGHWPAMQLIGEKPEETNEELAAFAILLPAAPVYSLQQLKHDNETISNELLSYLVALREDASIAHGEYTVRAVRDAITNATSLIACARRKAGHTGYVAVYNGDTSEARAQLGELPAVPEVLTVYHVSHAVHVYTNYSHKTSERSDNVLVPPKSTVVLTYVPLTAVED